MSNFPKSNLVKKLLFEEFGGGGGRKGGRRGRVHTTSLDALELFFIFMTVPRICASPTEGLQ